MSLNALRLPHTGPRVETGPVQFGDDWPGIFIRGDNAIMFAASLRDLLACLRNVPQMPSNVFLDIQILDGLLSDLESCIVRPNEEPS